MAQSRMLHFNFSQESTQFLFGIVSDFVLCKAANFQSAFNLSRFQTTSPSRERTCSLKIQCIYIPMCRVIKLLTSEFRDAAGSSNDERMTMLAFSESGSNHTWYLAMKMWLVLMNLVIFLILSLGKKTEEIMQFWNCVQNTSNLAAFSIHLRKCWGKKYKSFFLLLKFL